MDKEIKDLIYNYMVMTNEYLTTGTIPKKHIEYLNSRANDIINARYKKDGVDCGDYKWDTRLENKLMSGYYIEKGKSLGCRPPFEGESYKDYSNYVKYVTSKSM